MFDDLIRQVKKLENGTTLSIPVEPDAEGYFDKECPSKNCLFQFKVNSDDWTNVFKDEAVYCPLCGHQAPADSWWTTEQIEQATNQATNYVAGILGDSLRKSATDFNRKQPKNSFVKLSLEVKGTRGRRAIIPITSSEPIELKIICEDCGTRFAVIGSAFFCPCCGKSSAYRTFDNALRKITIKLKSVELIMKQFHREGLIDESEILARSLIETSLSDCVVAFQRFAEQLYVMLPNTQTPPMNVFQRIHDGSKLWQDTTGEGYSHWLTQAEIDELNILFHKRHLLLHTEGIVDQRYINRSGDTTYTLGQRIVVKEEDVQQLVVLIQKLTNKMKEQVV